MLDDLCNKIYKRAINIEETKQFLRGLIITITYIFEIEFRNLKSIVMKFINTKRFFNIFND